MTHTRHLIPPNRTSSAKNRLYFVESLVKEAPWDTSQASQTIANAIVCFLQSDGKALLLKTILTYIIKYREVNLCLTRSFAPTERHSAYYQRRKLSSISLSYKFCALSERCHSGTNIVGVNNHSLVDLTAYSMRWNPYSILLKRLKT